MIISKASFFTKLSLVLLLLSVKPVQAAGSAAKRAATGTAIALLGVGAYKLYSWWFKPTPKQIFEQKYNDYLVGECDVNYIFDNGQTLLMQALEFGYPQKAICLLNNESINLNLLDSKGASALIYAIRIQNIELVNIIINNNNFVKLIDVAETYSGFTPLMYAVIYCQDNMQIIDLLLNKGADCSKYITFLENEKNVDGRNVYDLALDLKRYDIIENIKKKNIDKNLVGARLASGD